MLTPSGGAVMTDSLYSVRKSGVASCFEIDTDKARLDRVLIHDFLANSHWARGIPMAVVERAIEHSLAFGLYRNGLDLDGQQIGFARIVTDWATFAYLADVFVLPEARGQGLGQWLVETILAHPELQGMRRWLLGTRHAHGLYRRSGFREPAAPFAFLERNDPEIYLRNAPRRRKSRSHAATGAESTPPP
jgi:GNAT superfamily N-acetyltransferase